MSGVVGDPLRGNPPEPIEGSGANREPDRANSPRRAEGLWRGAARIWGILPLVYLLVGLVGGSVMMLDQPPGQTPDAYYHLYKAAEVANGQLFARHVGRGATGGSVPRNYNLLPNELSGVSANPIRHQITRAELSILNRTPAASPLVTVDNSPSAIYPPLFYLPQALGLDIAQWFGGSVLGAYELAVVFNGLAAVGLSYLALRWSEMGRSLLFVVLALPMTISEYFSISQDALMIAFAAAAFGLLSRGLSRPIETKGEYNKLVWWSTGLLLAVNLARPVYLPMLILPLLLKPPPAPLEAVAGGRRFWARLWRGLRARHQVLAALVVAAALETAWLVVDAAVAYVPPSGRGVNSVRQLYLLLNSPAYDLTVIAKTFSQQWVFYLHSMEGGLGWLTIFLPGWAYFILSGCLIWAYVVGDPPPPDPVPAARQLTSTASRASVVVIACALSFAFICGAELLTWTPVGFGYVEGVQGRYFLPFLPYLGLARWTRRRPWGGPLVALTPVIPMALLASILVGSAGLLELYYIRP